jgi:hypothetical protein
VPWVREKWNEKQGTYRRVISIMDIYVCRSSNVMKPKDRIISQDSNNFNERQVDTGWLEDSDDNNC